MGDLIGAIKVAAAFALNSQATTPVENVFRDGVSFVRSDCDAQLIVVVPFSSFVRLSAIMLRCVPGEEPALLKVFLDKRELSFEDVEDTRAAFEVKGASDAWHGKQINLPAVKFPACESVTLFFDAPDKDTVVRRALASRAAGVACQPGPKHLPINPPNCVLLSLLQAISRLVFFGATVETADLTKMTAG